MPYTRLVFSRHRAKTSSTATSCTAAMACATRSPIGKFQGGLAGFRAPQLGGLAIAEAIQRAGIEASDVEEVIFGNVLQAGLGQNPARQAARAAGVPTRSGA